jgi:hypothetical protein
LLDAIVEGDSPACATTARSRVAEELGPVMGVLSFVLHPRMSIESRSTATCALAKAAGIIMYLLQYDDEIVNSRTAGEVQAMCHERRREKLLVLINEASNRNRECLMRRSVHGVMVPGHQEMGRCIFVADFNRCRDTTPSCPMSELIGVMILA